MKKVLSIVLAVIFAVSMPLSVFAQGTASFNLTDEDTKTVKEAFESSYTNKVIVVPTWSLSDLGKSTKVTSKADLTNFDKDKLVFYNYSKADNKTSKIEEPSYSINTEGKLSFTTNSNQGFVIVSNGALEKKTATAPASAPAKEVSSTVYWVSGGKVYHSTKDCTTLKRSSNIQAGSTTESKKERGCKVCH